MICCAPKDESIFEVWDEGLIKFAKYIPPFYENPVMVKMRMCGQSLSHDGGFTVLKEKITGQYEIEFCSKGLPVFKDLMFWRPLDKGVSLIYIRKYRDYELNRFEGE